MKNKKWLLIAILWTFIILFTIVYSNINRQEDNNIVSSNQSEIQKKEYEHSFPSRVSKNDYLKWEFISNDIASIYPRREALVRDILVDIWDNVQVWDTLAILFNPWVEWEWQSEINIKNTVVSSKKSLLNETINVKSAKIAELDQIINENEIVLQETINNFDSKILQIWWDSDTSSEYSVQIKSLENLEKNLKNAKELKNELLSESNNNIVQKKKLLSSKIDELYNNIIPILYLWNEDDIDFRKINTSDFSDYLWAKNSMSLWELKTIITAFHNNYDNLDLEQKYNDLLDINDKLITVLQNTIVSVSAWTTESILASHISTINTYSTSLISQKEILDDAENMYKVLEIKQKEKIENIELQISKKENEISLLWTKINSTESEKRLVIEQLKAKIETLKKSKDLLIANEDKAITMLENEIFIAKADLNSEYIKSGDYKIISPFTWVISKRWIEIWEKISSNIEAFRLAWVETTLSRITKKEIKFHIPENLKDNLEMWKEITFSNWDNEWKSFTWTIYRISPEVDEDNLSITVQAKVSENIKLPNKSTVKVNLETKQEMFKIPSSTIYNKEDRKIVYYKKDNWKLWIRDINIISDDWEYSLITWNITDDLKIVTTPIFIK